MIMPRKVAPIILILMCFSRFGTAIADWQEFGVRLGIQSGPKHEYFHSYEAFLKCGLPWEWRMSSGWGIGTRIETSVGALLGGNETGFISSLGTGLVFNKPGNGIELEAGVNLDFMDRSQFGRQDFGSILLFGAYTGFLYRFQSRVGIGYRMQHLSNNRILYDNCTPNPGVDMHLIGVSWHF